MLAPLPLNSLSPLSLTVVYPFGYGLTYGETDITEFRIEDVDYHALPDEGVKARVQVATLPSQPQSLTALSGIKAVLNPFYLLKHNCFRSV